MIGFLESRGIEPFDKIQKIIVWSDFIEDGFLALRAGVLYHVAFVFSVVDTFWKHLTMALGCSIPGMNIIYMLGAETERTVVSGRTFRVSRDERVTVFTFEGFVVHNKSHILEFGITVAKMAGKFTEEVYEFRLIKWVFFHESLE